MMVMYMCMFVLLAGHAALVSGYANGAGSKSCRDLVPGHGSQASGTPVSITTSQSSVAKGGSVTVTLSGASFNALIMQARRTGSQTPIGTWTTTAANTKTMKCDASGDTLTHSSSTAKNSGTTFTWTAPTSCNPGTIKFHLTVAPGESSYYLGMTSSDVTTSGYAPTDVQCAGSKLDNGGVLLIFLVALVGLGFDY